MTITPISDLRNYGRVLEQVSADSPVYLTRNGKGAYCIRDIADDERFRKAEAMIRLLSELNAGIRSGEEEGWYTDDEVAERLRAHREERR